MVYVCYELNKHNLLLQYISIKAYIIYIQYTINLSITFVFHNFIFLKTYVHFIL